MCPLMGLKMLAVIFLHFTLQTLFDFLLVNKLKILLAHGLGHVWIGGWEGDALRKVLPACIWSTIIITYMVLSLNIRVQTDKLIQVLPLDPLLRLHHSNHFQVLANVNF